MAGMWSVCPSYCVTFNGGLSIELVDILTFVIIPGYILIDSDVVTIRGSTSSSFGSIVATLVSMILGV